MYAVNAPALPTSPTTPHASVASMIMPQNPSLGRLPVQSVAPTISYAEIKNEARNNPSFMTMPAEVAAAAGASPEESLAHSPASTGRMSSFPVLFLAQLMGQGMDAEAQSLVVSYETMKNFEDVKYKPSNATRPAPGSAAQDFMKALAETAGKEAVKTAAPVQAQAATIKQEQPQPASMRPVAPVTKGAATAPVSNKTNAIRAYAAAIQHAHEHVEIFDEAFQQRPMLEIS